MNAPPLHVVFTRSAAGCLRAAISEVGREGRVVCFPDTLHFGPINPPAPELRRTWVEEELGWINWGEDLAQHEAFWKASDSHEGPRIAWVSGRRAVEYAGFLEWLYRLGDISCDIVDLSDVLVTWQGKSSMALSLGMLPSRLIVQNGLLDSARALPSTVRQKYLALWQRLRFENAPLRVIGEEDLQSAPISFFDRSLLSYATADWQKIARVVHHVLSDFHDDLCLQTCDLVLVSRVWALIDAGLLESRGDVSNIRSGEVRLLNV